MLSFACLFRFWTTTLLNSNLSKSRIYLAINKFIPRPEPNIRFLNPRLKLCKAHRDKENYWTRETRNNKKFIFRHTGRHPEKDHLPLVPPDDLYILVLNSIISISSAHINLTLISCFLPYKHFW